MSNDSTTLSYLRARPRSAPHRPTVAEFFAGIGLMRAGLESAGFAVVWANDISAQKAELYRQNFGNDHFRLGDICALHAEDIPTVDLASASFPCTDLSLAGDRAGLGGSESGMFWEFERILREMGPRRPAVVVLENVAGLATSHGGSDLVAMLSALNQLGYVCDIAAVDARHFVAQSRPRLFVIATQSIFTRPYCADGNIRPVWAQRLAIDHPQIRLHASPAPTLPVATAALADFVEHLPADDRLWWDKSRTRAFIDSLSPIQATRLEVLSASNKLTWRTAYRRTRNGIPVWEIRNDDIAGCLRTARGGSSKQAVLRAGDGVVQVRWMTPREYARLQGAPDYFLGDVPNNQALFGFGDAVCVPAVAWVATHLLRPMLDLARSSPPLMAEIHV